MSTEINEMVITSLAQEERISVKNGNPLIKSIVLNDKDGNKIPALATVYNRPGNGVYRKQTYGVVLIPMSIENLRKFSNALLVQAQKIEDANLALHDQKETTRTNEDLDEQQCQEAGSEKSNHE